MAQEHSIVETFDIMSDFTWRDEWLTIIDMPDRIGELDYELESFRQSYNNYLRDIALQAESIEADILAATMHGMMSNACPDSDPWYHPPYDDMAESEPCWDI